MRSLTVLCAIVFAVGNVRVGTQAPSFESLDQVVERLRQEPPPSALANSLRLTSCGGTQMAGAALPPIERHGVGTVVVGAPAQKVYEVFPRDRRELVDLGYEGFLSPALVLRFAEANQPDGVVAELVGGPTGLTVWRVQVRDPAFRTRKGIGVGSTVGELRAVYRLDSVISGEGTVAIRVEELSASFALDQSGPGGDRLWLIKAPAGVADSVKIKSVLLN